MELAYMELLEVVHQTDDLLPLLPTEEQLLGCKVFIERNAAGNLSVTVSYPEE